jgi:hypothetical protein
MLRRSASGVTVIIATMFGGPRDGLEIAVQELTPLVFPVITGVNFEEEPRIDAPMPIMSTVTYVPRRDTLKPCPYCPTPAQHFSCTYYVSGWGR